MAFKFRGKTSAASRTAALKLGKSPLVLKAQRYTKIARRARRIELLRQDPQFRKAMAQHIRTIRATIRSSEGQKSVSQFNRGYLGGKKRAQAISRRMRRG